MPELPEVEFAARQLGAWLSGKRIDRAAIAPTRIVRGSSAAAVEALLTGRVVAGVERRGKWLRIDLEGGPKGPRRGSTGAAPALYAHLGMTGKWLRRSTKDVALQHERARLDAGALSVRYVDPRLFGRLVPAPAGVPPEEWTALGPDPLGDGIDPARFEAELGRRKGPVKVALLDQTLLAGLGNIQATEALWRAGLHPARPAASLGGDEVARLVAGITGTLADTLAREAGPEITYVEEAGAANPFSVYGRGGQPCPRCGAPLLRMVLAGRGTVYCARCQPKKA